MNYGYARVSTRGQNEERQIVALKAVGVSQINIYLNKQSGNMKFAYRSREFWCSGYYVDTTGKNTEVIKRYIANQLKEDREND